jgi:multimeric flavodoxin WrbA
MKNFLDRLAFVFHRPRFFGKAFTAIVVQGIYGGDSIIKYLETVGGLWGFNVAKGCSLTALMPITTPQQQKLTQEIKKVSKRFYKELMRPMTPTPSFFKMMMFRFQRTGYLIAMDEKFKDYRYFKEKGWFESDYYYDSSLGFIKKLAGRFFDFLGEWIAKKKFRT